MKKLFVLIVCAWSLTSCQQVADRNRVVSKAALDTIQSSVPETKVEPEYYELAFARGHQLKVGETTVSFFGFTAGNVKLGSGRIVVCDPLHIDEYGLPFTETFPQGSFPVQLSVLQAGGEESIAFARIKFSDEPVVRWKQALRERQKEVGFGGEDNPEVYCVDGGAAIFLDFEATKVLELPVAANFDGPIFNEMYKNHRIGWRFAMYDFGQYNLAAFTTGLGDGCFKSYIGYDAAGRPCRLLTDFGLVGKQ